MATNTNDSTEKLAKILASLTEHMVTRFTNEDIKKILVLFDESDIRRLLHRKIVQDVRCRPLKRVFCLTDGFAPHFDEIPRYGWELVLTEEQQFVQVQIASEVFQESAIASLKSILAFLEKIKMEWPDDDMPKQIWTEDHGNVIAVPGEYY